MGNDYTTYQKLMLGEPVHFDEARPEEERTIPASWVKEAVARGRKIDISHAIIQGDLNLRYATVKAEVSIRESTIAGCLDLSFSKIEQGLSLTKTAVAGEALFIGVKFGGVAVFTGATFEKQAAFDRAEIAGSAAFDLATFKGEARFLGVKFGGQALFRGATFEGEARFLDVKLGGPTVFRDAVFEKEAAFDRAEIAGGAFFDPATFKGEGIFRDVKFGGPTVFRDAVFEKEAAFDRAEIAGDAFFDPATFKGRASFPGVKFGGQAVFTGATFERDVWFEEAAITGRFLLCSLAQEHARKRTSFKGVSFRAATCGTVVLQTADSLAPDIDGALDAVGWTYKHIEGQEELLKLLDTKMEDYDRQPFTQLEKVARERGDDAFANEVYYHGRTQEYHKLIRPFSKNPDLAPVPKFLSWLGRVIWDRLLFLFVGYGVKPLRLIAWVIGIVALLTLVFEKAGTVALKGASGAPDLTLGESFWFSLNLFVPGVQLFVPGEWKPADAYIILANFFRLFGWLIAGIGIAYLTGIARRLSRG